MRADTVPLSTQTNDKACAAPERSDAPAASTSSPFLAMMSPHSSGSVRDSAALVRRWMMNGTRSTPRASDDLRQSGGRGQAHVGVRVAHGVRLEQRLEERQVRREGLLLGRPRAQRGQVAAHEGRPSFRERGAISQPSREDGR